MSRAPATSSPSAPASVDRVAGFANRAGNLLAAGLCLAASAGFLALAWQLPAGHSAGDVGPAALPVQVGVAGVLLSLAYLWISLRGGFAAERVTFEGFPRALAVCLVLVLGLIAVRWIGLAIAIGIVAGLTTLAFDGTHRILRAGLTGLALWGIAVLLFGRLLGLPLP
ncbi:tripartite tricarboxylate transporter TctB family protein [Frigidibacter sp. MR17.14]|uniref:tripartite tricarboxylate transporter TctB family protein n=1 Tax=Frigidibacter sp. MR17.14 TaxID=3126509 RepID=UPI00301319F6